MAAPHAISTLFRTAG